jgi:carbonic anhydrase/acetyltransferase-like protein (isoleucine patch superfamily)
MAGILVPYDGYQPTVAPDAFIAQTAVLLGDVVVEAGASIWYGAVLRADGNLLRIGARTNIQDGTVIHVNHQEDGGRGAHSFSTIIGADVTVGHMAMLHACTLEDGAFVGMKACVMDGATVEGGGMVAAGALITPGKRVKKGELWAGSPAKFLRPLRPEEIAYFPESARYYAEVAQRYRKAGL